MSHTVPNLSYFHYILPCFAKSSHCFGPYLWPKKEEYSPLGGGVIEDWAVGLLLGVGGFVVEDLAVGLLLEVVLQGSRGGREVGGFQTEDWVAGLLLEVIFYWCIRSGGVIGG